MNLKNRSNFNELVSITVVFAVLVSLWLTSCGEVVITKLKGAKAPMPNYPQTPVGSAFSLNFEDNTFPSAIFEEYINPIHWTSRLVEGRIAFSGGMARLSNSMADWDGNRLTSGGVISLAYYGYGDLSFRLKASQMSGIVTSLYLYAEDKDLSLGGVHDEIDVELSSANPGKASLMLFHDAPDGLWVDDGSDRIAGGIVDIRAVKGLSGFNSTEFHTWKISYRPTEVIWYANGIQVYRLTRAVPKVKIQIFFETYYNRDWEDFSGPLSGSGTAELDSISYTPMP